MSVTERISYIKERLEGKSYWEIWLYVRKMIFIYLHRFRAVNKSLALFAKLSHPLGGIQKDVLYAFYDGSRNVFHSNDSFYAYNSFDMMTFLFLAENKRIERNLRGIYVVIHLGEGSNFWRYSEQSREFGHNGHWRFFNMVIQSLALLPSLTGFCVCSTPQEVRRFWAGHWRTSFPDGYSYYFPTVAHSIRSVFALPENAKGRLESGCEARRQIDRWIELHGQQKRIITITLREYRYFQKRNSNVEAWARFCETIDTDKYCVVVLRDTDAAFDTGVKFGDAILFAVPCFNLQLRLALYEKAYLNLGTNCGCLAAYFYSDCNYLYFMQTVDDDPDYGFASKNEWERAGVIPNKTFAFRYQKGHQKMIWERDSYEVIRKEFDLMTNAMENAQPPDGG